MTPDPTTTHTSVLGRPASLLPHAVHFGTSLARYSTSGCTVVEVSYLPGHQSPDHAHESPFIHAVLSGQAIQDAPERPVRGAGDVCFYPAHRQHSHAVLERGWHALAVDILPSYALDFEASGADLSRPIAISDAELIRTAARLQNEIRHPDPLSRLQVDALVIDLCSTLIRLGSRESDRVPAWMRRLVNTIGERYTEDLTLEMLAAEVGVHPVYAGRVFRKLFGETVGDYVRRKRISEARRLLEHSSEPIARIAADTGYHDESHFSRAFKTVVGTAPGRYRQMTRSVMPRTAFPLPNETL